MFEVYSEFAVKAYPLALPPDPPLMAETAFVAQRMRNVTSQDEVGVPTTLRRHRTHRARGQLGFCASKTFVTAGVPPAVIAAVATIGVKRISSFAGAVS